MRYQSGEAATKLNRKKWHATERTMQSHNGIDCKFADRQLKSLLAAQHASIKGNVEELTTTFSHKCQIDDPSQIFPEISVVTEPILQQNALPCISLDEIPLGFPLPN